MVHYSVDFAWQSRPSLIYERDGIVVGARFTTKQFQFMIINEISLWEWAMQK